MTPSGDTASSQSASTTIGIASPRFLAFLTAQFLGNANDNAFKVTLILFVLSLIVLGIREAYLGRVVRHVAEAVDSAPLPGVNESCK